MNLTGYLYKLKKAKVFIYVENDKVKVKGDKNNLDPQSIGILKSNKDQIIELYNSLDISSNQQLELPSYAQKRLWVLDQIEPGQSQYNIPAALVLEGKLDVSALEGALNDIVERHESLRTTFMSDEDGEPYQVIHAAKTLQVQQADFSHLSEEAQEAVIREQVSEEGLQGFDLTADLMLRGRLLKLRDDKHVVLVTMHHIASDGWSMSLLIKEFSALYRARVEGTPNPLAPLSVQYGDYAHWQREWLSGDVLARQLNYWETQLSDLPVLHGLPLDHARPHEQTFNGAVHRSELDASVTSALMAYCQSHEATLFMGLHAVFAGLLSRYSNESDIVVGSPIANREQAEIAELIGFFVNTLVLRSDLSGSPGFETLLLQSKEVLLSAYEYQQVPFEQVVERLQPERSLSHSPLFQVMLILQNAGSGELDLPGLSLRPLESAEVMSKYDLTLTVVEHDGRLVLEWEYNRDLFEARSIGRMAEHFGVLLSAALASPRTPIESLALLTGAEREQVLHQWNATERALPSQVSLAALFEAQVASTPTADALVFEGASLSYAALNAR
ncbi:condensation domain-containing protein, partial [Planctobacterium marinum]|uniref:condensation domain-containing protein n=3 Tax=Planctobacterium marinum TaxID=1631968 RepID=UPI001E324170